MCPRRPRNLVSDAFVNNEEPVETVVVPTYFCHRGIGFVHETGNAALCRSCFFTATSEKPTNWSRIRMHQLTIAQPIAITCESCNDLICTYRNGDQCTPCTIKLVQYLRQYGIPELSDNVITIAVGETIQTTLQRISI